MLVELLDTVVVIVHQTWPLSCNLLLGQKLKGQNIIASYEVGFQTHLRENLQWSLKRPT